MKNWTVEITSNGTVVAVKVKANDRNGAKDQAEKDYPGAERIWGAYTETEWAKL